MAVIIDLYGILDKNLEAVARTLTAATGSLFELHSSDYWGDYYGAHSSNWQEKLYLKENFNQIEGELTWPEFSNYPLMLEVVVKSIARSREIEQQVLQALTSKAILLDRYEKLETDKEN